MYKNIDNLEVKMLKQSLNTAFYYKALIKNFTAISDDDSINVATNKYFENIQKVIDFDESGMFFQYLYVIVEYINDLFNEVLYKNNLIDNQALVLIDTLYDTFLELNDEAVESGTAASESYYAFPSRYMELLNDLSISNKSYSLLDMCHNYWKHHNLKKPFEDFFDNFFEKHGQEIKSAFFDMKSDEDLKDYMLNSSADDIIDLFCSMQYGSPFCIEIDNIILPVKIKDLIVSILKYLISDEECYGIKEYSGNTYIFVPEHVEDQTIAILLVLGVKMSNNEISLID